MLIEMHTLSQFASVILFLSHYHDEWDELLNCNGPVNVDETCKQNVLVTLKLKFSKRSYAGCLGSLVGLCAYNLKFTAKILRKLCDDQFKRRDGKW